MSDLTTSFNCRICGEQELLTHHKAREMMFGVREVFDYLECKVCGCLQIQEVPADMGAYYPENYYSFGKYDGKKFKGSLGSFKRWLYKQAIKDNKLVQRLFGISEYNILSGLKINTESRILDVGCGNGKNFLYPLAEAGFHGVKGCDPFLSETLEYENGLVVEKADVFDMDGSWDLITYHHAFEHLEDPKKNLQKVEELLKPGGVCILRIPTVSSYAWKHYKTDWVQLDAPRHIFLHSKESIEQLAAETDLLLEKVIYDSTFFQFIGSEKYLKDIPLSAPKDRSLLASLQRKWDKWRYQRQANRLNRSQQGDQAAFFLRKK